MSTPLDQLIQQQEQMLKVAIENAIKKALKDIKISKESISTDLYLELVQMAKSSPKINIPKGNFNMPMDKADECEISFKINQTIAAIITDLVTGNNVYLYGLAGTGKTYTAEKIGEMLGIPTFTINCSQWTSPTIIVGGQTIEGYREGLLVKAWKDGGLLILDELPKLDPNTAGLLNDALSKTGNQPDICGVSKEEYEKGVAKGQNAKTQYYKGEDVPKEVFQFAKKGGFYRVTFPTITSGEGRVYRKHPNFCVIASGNTTMQEQSVAFGGNNRQDYSLIDRFAGSYYEVSFDEALEKSLTYEFVYELCTAIREVILLRGNAAEQAITLRTMLNFNRTYEVEMLSQMDVQNLNYYKGVEVNNMPMFKTIQESFDSFLLLLPQDDLDQINQRNIQQMVTDATAPNNQQRFVADFERLRGIDLTKAPYNVVV
jgi:hypothetical protein